jgi:hypothetical protein
MLILHHCRFTSVDSKSGSETWRYGVVCLSSRLLMLEEKPVDTFKPLKLRTLLFSHQLSICSWLWKIIRIFCSLDQLGEAPILISNVLGPYVTLLYCS